MSLRNFGEHSGLAPDSHLRNLKGKSLAELAQGSLVVRAEVRWMVQWRTGGRVLKRHFKRAASESEIRSVVSDSLQLHALYSPWTSPGQNTGVGNTSLLQGICPIQGSNLGLPHCRQILYHLSHQGSPKILKWVAYPFSSRSSQPRNQTGVSCIAYEFLPTEL